MTTVLPEVEGVFETQQLLELEWCDPRISLHDLQEHDYQNTLLEAEKNLIWIPSVTFLNTAHQERSARDNSSMVTVSRLGPRTRSSISERKNIYIYKGSENPLLIGRVYSVKWLCSYDMEWYPFVTQVSQVTSTCPMWSSRCASWRWRPPATPRSI